MGYTARERRLLARYFSVLEPRDHADVYLVRNLPPEVAATLNGVYSRTHLSMRDSFLQRLKQGLAESGRSLDDLPLGGEAGGEAGGDAGGEAGGEAGGDARSEEARSAVDAEHAVDTGSAVDAEHAVDTEGAAPRDALAEVLADRSGKFLKTYAIDHGHNSLREGSVLHLAVENVSQLVTRFVQRERRCSFEESSTRYLSFSGERHWRDPDIEAAGGDAAAAYGEIIDTTFALYERATRELIAALERRRPLRSGEDPAAYRRALKAEAFDAARYLLTPALLTKWGMVVDARTLSEMIAELLSHPLAEFRIVGQRLQEQGDLAVPTLLSHARPNAYAAELHRLLPEVARALQPPPLRRGPPAASAPAVELLSWDRDLDNRLLASLAYESASTSLEQLRAAARSLPHAERVALLQRVLGARGPRDALPLALEGAAPFEFELLVDFGAYRDIGRHRKGFQQQQLLTTEHGYLVPPTIRDIGLGDEFCRVLDAAAERREAVARRSPLAAGYVTPFAFLQRVRLVFDPRQAAYFIELRSAPEGHFAYRDVAIAMHREISKVSPLFASAIRVQAGHAFMGRMEAEQGADQRRRARMERAGDLP